MGETAVTNNDTVGRIRAEYKAKLLKLLRDRHREFDFHKREAYEVEDTCFYEGAMEAINLIYNDIEEFGPDLVHYSMVWMGPISADWIKQNGNDWSAGRMDTDHGSPHTDEIGVPVMKTEDWDRLSQWLRTYTSVGLKTLDEIVIDFENQTGASIRWWKPLQDECED